MSAEVEMLAAPVLPGLSPPPVSRAPDPRRSGVALPKGAMVLSPAPVPLWRCAFPALPAGPGSSGTPVSERRSTMCALFRVSVVLIVLVGLVTAWGEPVVIVGELDDGIPDPSPLRPELPNAEILETVTHQLADRKITIHRIKDPNWPNPPPPVPRMTELSPEEMEAFRNSPEVQQWLQAADNSTHLFIFATVVDHRATLLRWWHDGAEYRAWSNANWLYLTGFSECRKGDRSFLPLLAAVDIDSARLPEDSPYRIPEDLPAEPGSYYVIHGDLANAAAFEGITALHELYRSDYDRLKAAYELRKENRQAYEAALRANPPVPEDIVLYYSKMLPEQSEGGSR